MGFLSGIKRQLTTLNITYLGGHPDLTKSPIAVGVGKEDDMIVIYFGPTFSPKLKIPKADITNVTLEKASKRSLGKAAAGAIVGGVLTGGIGAIAGAALGGRKKDDSVIVMTIKYGPAEVDVLFGGDDVSKKYSQFVALLR